MSRQPLINWTLKNKFLATTITLVMVTSLVTILVVYVQLSSLLVNEKYSQLHQNLSFIKASLRQDIEQLRLDAQNLADSRLIKGIIQSGDHENNLINLLKREEWNESLGVLFYQTIVANHNYFQVRYLEYEQMDGQPSAMEQVVVQRKNDEVIVLAPYEMQDKIHRDYVQQSLNLAPSQVHLSELSLNREYGAITEDKVATLRAIAPVYSQQKLHGFVIINMDLSLLFQRAKNLISTESEFFAYRSDGQYFYHSDKRKVFSFEFPEDVQHTIQQDYFGSEQLLELNEMVKGKVYSTTQLPYAMIQQSLFFDPMQPERVIKLALIQSYDTINEITVKLNRSLITTGVIICIVAITAALLILRNISRPIQQLLSSIKRFGHSQQVTNLPVQRPDEIGTLARSFERMSEQVKQQTTQLHQENLMRRFTEKRLRQEEKELKRSNSELEKFAYVASHDLQEPLRKVQAFGDRLRARIDDQLDEKSKDYLSRMLQAANRMSTLISDLLSFSRIATHGRSFKSCDLNETLKGVINDLEVALEQSKTQLEIGELPKLKVDEPQIRQLFQNLVGNAIKFRKPEGEHKLVIWSKVKDNGKEVSIHFKDNGIGLEQQYAERIFEVFQRLHARTEYDGTGIGLAICRKIVDRHGGNIKVVSTLNSGAEFIVTLPLNH